MNQPASDQSDSAAYFDADHEWRKKKEPELDRLERTLAILPSGLESLLDVGVGEGDWLRLLAERRPGLRLAALDVSPKRLAELEVRHADGSDIDRHEGDFTKTSFEGGTFDAVTLLEVVEHLPDWRAAVTEALRMARRGVLVTVPYRERLMSTVCVHCHRATPLWGHLHTFDQHSFDEFRDRAWVKTRPIPRPPRREDGFFRFVFRSLRPKVWWMGFWLEKKTG